MARSGSRPDVRVVVMLHQEQLQRQWLALQGKEGSAHSAYVGFQFRQLHIHRPRSFPRVHQAEALRLGQLSSIHKAPVPERLVLNFDRHLVIELCPLVEHHSDVFVDYPFQLSRAVVNVVHHGTKTGPSRTGRFREAPRVIVLRGNTFAGVAVNQALHLHRVDLKVKIPPNLLFTIVPM
jgi:hypothetical protein